MRHYLIIAILFISSSLLGQDTIRILKNNTDTVEYKIDTTIVNRGDKVDTMIGITLKFEPKSYFYQYDSSLGSEMANFDRGFIDTFSINKNKFRVRADKGECCIVENNKSGKWRKNFFFDYTQYKYDKSRDVNGDGYCDFISNLKRMSEVYLFDTSSMQFIDTSFQIIPDWVELNKSKKIFCNDWSLYKISSKRSELYTFYRDQIKVLYYLEFIGDKSDESIKKIIIYKVTKKADIKISELNVSIKEYDFDYKKFWSSRYKKLMGYR